MVVIVFLFIHSGFTSLLLVLLAASFRARVKENTGDPLPFTQTTTSIVLESTLFSLTSHFAKSFEALAVPWLMTWKTHCLIPRTSTEKESIWNACHWKKSLSNLEHHGEDFHPKMRKPY